MCVYMCVYVCICLHVYVHVHVYACACTHACICVCMCMNVCVHVCICMRMYVCLHVCICSCACMCICMCMYVCTWLRCLGVVSALRWSTGQQSGDSMRMGGGECWGERAAQSPSDAGTEHRLGSRKEGEGVWFVCPNGWPCGCRRLVSVMAKMAKPISSSVSKWLVVWI